MHSHPPNVENGTRLAIELGTELQLDISGLGYHMKSTLIGLESAHYIIVKIPRALPPSTIVNSLVPNTRVVVRYIYRGTVFGFETYIIQATIMPVHVLFLAYPKTIAEQNIREYQRITCLLPAHVTVDNHVIEGTITDISQKGCNWHTKRDKLPEQPDVLDGLNKKIHVELELPGTNEQLKVIGEEKNIRKDGAAIDVGIEFTDVENVQRKILTSFLDSLEEYL